MKQKLSDLLDEASAIELQVADIYEHLSNQFKAEEPLSHFWALFAEAERYHSLLIQMQKLGMTDPTGDSAQVDEWAGEIAETVIQGYSNKQHDGFLGHACLGEWCNLGADTNNSDLKNNYGNVVVTLKGRPVKTGRRFVGLMMGDHSKTAINTMFNTGTVVGIFANIWGGGFPQTEIPAFSWGGPPGGFVPYRVNKALDTSRVVMDRRQQVLSPAMAALATLRSAEAGHRED